MARESFNDLQLNGGAPFNVICEDKLDIMMGYNGSSIKRLLLSYLSIPKRNSLSSYVTQNKISSPFNEPHQFHILIHSPSHALLTSLFSRLLQKKYFISFSVRSSSFAW